MYLTVEGLCKLVESLSAHAYVYSMSEQLLQSSSIESSRDALQDNVSRDPLVPLAIIMALFILNYHYCGDGIDRSFTPVKT